ncbi:MAG: nicotinate-nucleotide adenylyltransferase [Sphingobacteriia bacterium]|nr:nicotinate-nucleotide adenylyltransferase [Sphingobacteriia bacterium]NCC38088.1 nicotinate-nucleotide adenylyltransferase [Gammaproteobacteria bacterium]
MIGILGGTFDPIHLGHLRPALDCLEALGLAQVRFIPLNVAVHRPQPHAPAALRLAMVEAAIAGQPGFLVDPRELARPGGSYTFDTLVSLRAEVGPSTPLCLLVGADAFSGFLDWYRPLEILRLAHLVVMRRPSSDSQLSADLQVLRARHGCQDHAELSRTPAGLILDQAVTQLEVSSTRVRELIRAGRSPRYLLPDAVISIIASADLYR